MSLSGLITRLAWIGQSRCYESNRVSHNFFLICAVFWFERAITDELAAYER